MLKFKSIIAAGMLLLGTAAHADEGMWTLYNLPQAAYEQMKAEGFSMPYDMLYKSPDAIKNCVVNFSGYCSGVVVSPDGLVFTNHHCGFDAIRSHSTVEHDYMLNGFCAQSYEEELPNENMFVAFLQSQEDITARLEALNIRKLGELEAGLLIDSLEKVLNDSVKAIDSTFYVEIKPYYEGNSYYADVYQSFPDLRLVFALPKSMGKFGGETDNWMWPRQTCDFSVFRIYVDPETGKPAPYSEKNVPYHPKHWAPVSLQGYKEGDFSMTIGYPGSTERYLSSYGIQEMRDCENDPRQQVRGVKQAVMKRHMDASEAVRIKYDSKYANSANYWKNAIGMNKCIDSIGIINQKRDFETRIQQWLGANKNTEEQKLGEIVKTLNFEKLQGMYARRAESCRALTFFAETFSNTNELVTRGLRYCRGRLPLQGPENKPKSQYVMFDDNSESFDADLDKEVLWTLLENYEKHVDAKYLPSIYDDIKKNHGGSYKDYVNYVWDNSILMKSGVKIFPDKKETVEDPGVELALAVLETMDVIRNEYFETDEAVSEQERLLCAAKLRMEQDLPHYSDANFTMRLSYGQVGGYDLGGYDSGYYTTAMSMLQKIMRCESIEDYYAEPIMSEVLGTRDYGKYADKKTGTLQLCFLTNNDITGGNSGSPMFNGKGELIGLAFDGNWDSLSSDIFFDSKLARCIGVDIRYVLFMMQEWGHADHLIKEIGAK